MNVGAEDVMGFEEPGEEEKSGHDAGGPVEDQERECDGERRTWMGLRFAKDEAADS